MLFIRVSTCHTIAEELGVDQSVVGGLGVEDSIAAGLGVEDTITGELGVGQSTVEGLGISEGTSIVGTLWVVRLMEGRDGQESGM